ncbi:MAG: transposase, partial [Clostridiales bacterium]|nr:transposase [Clostridiales bacterium]
SLSLSAGTANAIVRRVSAKILGSGFMDAERFFILLFEKVLGVDETSACVNGRNAWVHTAVTANVTLLSAHWRRGYEGMVYAGVLQFYTMTIISDCWASYFNENFGFQHAVCNGHILRELVAAAYFRQQRWAVEMFDLLLEIFTAKRNAVEQGDKSLPQECLDDVRKRYQRIVADGFIEIADEKKGKTYSLLERLRKLEDAVLAFAVDFNVDFTNNASEQSLRNLKVALRAMGQFKTMTGLADYCIIQSFMDTCRKQGHNPFEMLRILLSGGDIIEAVFDAKYAAPIKQMIKFTDIVAAGVSDEIEDALLELPISITDELRAAVSYGRLKVYNDPPPVIT